LFFNEKEGKYNDVSGQFPKKIIVDTLISFSIDAFGLYAIFVTARCKSARQNDPKKNEMLRVEIDGLKLREIPSSEKPQYNKIASSWNGTDLKGLGKTVIFLLPLNKGEHTLSLIPTNGATIEKWSYQPIQNLQQIIFDLNENAEDGNRRPWYTLALINLPLKSFSAEIGVSWNLFDGDDIKLIFDGNIEKNNSSILWKNWIWSARPWQLLTGLKSEQKTFTKNLPQEIHYVELWADKKPMLNQIVLDLGDFRPKRIPTVDDPEWTKNFEDDTEAMLLSRLILGEAENQSREVKIWIASSILNRVNSKAWPNTFHEVILQRKQYDPFKPSNQNFPKITNPFVENASDLRRNNWHECYEVAKKILTGEIPNPTSATHFTGIGVDRDYFIKTYIPQGKFLRKIDDTNFYWSPN